MRARLAAVLALTLLAAPLAGCGDDGGSDGDGLPALDGSTAPTAYRVVYEVVTPDSRGTEEHTVQRPFESYIVERNADGQLTSERWAALGRLVTRSQGADAVRIDTAIAPAGGDLRLDRFAVRLVDAGRLREDETSEVGGRTCRFATEAGQVVTAPDADQPEGEHGALPVTISRCVDGQGLVLEERWTTAGGQRVLTKRAVELELGEDVPEVDVPDVDPLPDEQGNGAVREVAVDEPVPFVEAFALPAPEGFTFVGRYAVVPARLSNDPAALASDPGVALYTDVWTRGADLLLLDQGASRSGPAPFDPESAIGSVEVGGALGTATFAVDPRIAEVRSIRAEGGFVRLAGTIEPDELLALAATVTLAGGSP